VVFVTHEPDIAKCATRNVIFKDGLILRESAVQDRTNAREMLASIPIEAD
jgi:putative ABC transport system ATP-binding protein